MGQIQEFCDNAFGRFAGFKAEIAVVTQLGEVSLKS